MRYLKLKIQLFTWILTRKDIEIEYLLRWKKNFLENEKRQYLYELELNKAKEPSIIADEIFEDITARLTRPTSIVTHHEQKNLKTTILKRPQST